MLRGRPKRGIWAVEAKVKQGLYLQSPEGRIPVRSTSSHVSMSSFGTMLQGASWLEELV